jgi:polar amino acid transport system permease protein
MSAIDIFFNVDILRKSFPLLLGGLVNTVLLGMVAIVFGTLIGIFVCLARLYAPKPVGCWRFSISTSCAPCLSWSC